MNAAHCWVGRMIFGIMEAERQHEVGGRRPAQKHYFRLYQNNFSSFKKLHKII